jgi:ribonuclease D
VRRLAWQPPDPLSPGTVGDALASCGARPWQISLTAETLAGALAPAPEAEGPAESGPAESGPAESGPAESGPAGSGTG